jgi:DNA-binding transcriptional ArsR family regulator
MPPRLRPLDRHDVAPREDSSGLAVATRDGAARALVDPTRRRILAALQTPGSATTVARDVGLSRQLANYHVRALERAGLVEQLGRRPKRGLEERIVRATAAHYLVSPTGLPAPAPLSETADTFSATYQVAVAARTIQEVAVLAEKARAAGKRLTTLTIDTTVRFAAPADRERFANDLVRAVNRIVARYHDAHAPNGREYRLFLGAHPIGGSADRQPSLTTRQRSKS